MATHPMRGIGVLMRLSALAHHSYAQSCVDLDRNSVDVERLTQYSWSSGEYVLVNLVRDIYNGSGLGSTYDLTALDNDNRRVAVMALGAWLIGEGESTA